MIPRGPRRPPARCPDLRSLRDQIPALLGRRWFHLATILLLGTAAFSNALGGGFYLDDRPSILANEQVRTIFPLWNWAGYRTYTFVDQGVHALVQRDTARFTVAVNYKLHGYEPLGYKVGNVLIHLLTASVIYGFVARLLAQPRPGLDRGARAAPLAWIVTLIWSLNPIQGECANYTMSRPETLMSLFGVLTLYCILRHHQAERTLPWAVAAFFSALLCINAKQNGVSILVIAPFFDRICLSSSWRRVVVRRTKLYVSFLAMMVLHILTLPAQIYGGIKAVAESQGVTAWPYLMTQTGVLLHYLRQCFWPSYFTFDYHDWPLETSELTALIRAVPLVIGVGVLIHGLVRARLHGFLALVYYCVLGPSSSIMPMAEEFATERRMYLPLLPVVLAMTLAVDNLTRRLAENRDTAGRHALRLCTIAGLAAGISAYVLINRANNPRYTDEVSIWTDTLRKRPENSRAVMFTALLHGGQGDTAKAEELMNRTLELSPQSVYAMNEIGMNRATKGDLVGAARIFRKAVDMLPAYTMARVNLARTLVELGHTEAGIEEYYIAAGFTPGNSEIFLNLGNALARIGKDAEARRNYERALAIDPDYAEAYSNIGQLLAREGRIEEAIRYHQEGLRRRPEHPAIHFNLGSAYLKSGVHDKAAHHFTMCIRNDAENPDAWYNLGLARLAGGDVAGAVAALRRALELRPDDPGAADLLESLLAGADPSAAPPDPGAPQPSATPDAP